MPFCTDFAGLYLAGAVAIEATTLPRRDPAPASEIGKSEGFCRGPRATATAASRRDRVTTESWIRTPDPSSAQNRRRHLPPPDGGDRGWSSALFPAKPTQPEPISGDTRNGDRDADESRASRPATAAPKINKSQAQSLFVPRSAGTRRDEQLARPSRNVECSRRLVVGPGSGGQATDETPSSWSRRRLLTIGTPSRQEAAMRPSVTRRPEATREVVGR
jgi:hypothetical protein